MAEYLASPTAQPRAFEAPHAALSRRAAAEGMVLLENSGVLPAAPCRVALFGNGARRTVKGGTGSGDVNERSRVSVEQGLAEAGFAVATSAWLDRYDEVFRSRLQACCAKYEKEIFPDYIPTLTEYIGEHFRLPADVAVEPGDLDDSPLAVYVLARRSGEGRDRSEGPGDFLPTEEERASLRLLAEHYPHVVVVLNVGGVVDTSFYREDAALKNGGALLLMSQAGMRAGSALSDVLTGRVNPCGRLTDTWALRYRDYPASGSFSRNDGCPERAVYSEGTFVGYRYFEAFGLPVAYPFGYGLSYTSFSLCCTGLSLCGETVCADVRAVNTGARPGRGVAQLYLRAPSGEPEQPYPQLAAFGKTPVLEPGESCVLHLRFALRDHARYLESEACYALYGGDYPLYLGEHVRALEACGTVRLPHAVVTRRVRSALAPQEPVHELACRARAAQAVAPLLTLPAQAVREERAEYGPDEPPEEYLDAARALSDTALCALVTGRSSFGPKRRTADCARSVPGAGGETTALVRGVPPVVLADGPAGVRIQPHFFVDGGGAVRLPDPLESLEGGFLSQGARAQEGAEYFQYCTAFPIGTLLAQTWDTALAAEIGRAVSEEMRAFGVGIWLAPGMNLHRDPLCGRNFEYYSEDPALTAEIACGLIRGVQECGVTGATVKHFACNNQEERRMGSDSIVSERTLREIYLRSFERVVRDARPFALMTSYNLLNGVHTANLRALCTDVLRCEWRYDGLVMSDWGTTNGGDCTGDGCIRAGNDLVMPGVPKDVEEIREALRARTLTRGELERCAARVLQMIARVGVPVEGGAPDEP